MLRKGFRSTIGDSIRLRLLDQSCTSMRGMTKRIRQLVDNEQVNVQEAEVEDELVDAQQGTDNQNDEE
ncbi:hypothetical protein LWI28_005677 [Acer negundo]|uniref:Uncharacterized protein n=1 Tax=Acer negundo TaxID=4023 RepID=A0AAD5NJL4_ACENE|nr:hypothetical protein LWI28_005677 [Acer negundo]